MPKTERPTAEEAERLLLKSGFHWLRTKGSHRIYLRGRSRIVIPFYAGKILHPKIVKQVLQAVSEEY